MKLQFLELDPYNRIKIKCVLLKPYASYTAIQSQLRELFYEISSEHSKLIFQINDIIYLPSDEKFLIILFENENLKNIFKKYGVNEYDYTNFIRQLKLSLNFTEITDNESSFNLSFCEGQEKKSMRFATVEFKRELKAAADYHDARKKLLDSLRADSFLNFFPKDPKNASRPFRLQAGDLVPEQFWPDPNVPPVPFDQPLKFYPETQQSYDSEFKLFNLLCEKYKDILEKKSTPLTVAVIGAGTGGMVALLHLFKSNVAFHATVYEQRDEFSRLSQLIGYPGLEIDTLLDEEALNELLTSGGHYHLCNDVKPDDTLCQECDGFCAPTMVWQKTLKHFLEKRGVIFKQAKIKPEDLAGKVDLVISARGANSADAVLSPNYAHKVGRQIGFIMQTIHHADNPVLSPSSSQTIMDRQEMPYLYHWSGKFVLAKYGYSVSTYNSVSTTFSRRRDFFYWVTDDRKKTEFEDDQSDINWAAIVKSDLEEIIDTQLKRLQSKSEKSGKIEIREALIKEIIRLNELKRNLKVGDKIIFSECGVILRRDGAFDRRCLSVFHPNFYALSDRFIKHPRSLAKPIEHIPLVANDNKTEVARLGDEVGTPHWATGRGFYGPVWEGKYLKILAECIYAAKKLEEAAQHYEPSVKGKLIEDAEHMRRLGRKMYELAVNDIVQQIVITGMVMDLLPRYEDNHKIPKRSDERYYHPG